MDRMAQGSSSSGVKAEGYYHRAQRSFILVTMKDTVTVSFAVTMKPHCTLRQFPFT
jgi:hypothetical protein